MIESIMKWGIPDTLTGDYKFKFKGKLSYVKDREYDGELGFFCLWDIINDKEVIVVDIWAETNTLVQMIGGSKLPKLEVLHIPYEEYRHKGVANYYMGKLVQQLEEDGATGLRVLPNSNADLFKNNKSTLDMDNATLEKFYMKFESENFEIQIL